MQTLVRLVEKKTAGTRVAEGALSLRRQTPRARVRVRATVNACVDARMTPKLNPTPKPLAHVDSDLGASARVVSAGRREATRDFLNSPQDLPQDSLQDSLQDLP